MQSIAWSFNRVTRQSVFSGTALFFVLEFMNKFEDYISEKSIISCLIRLRAKRANETNKKIILHKISSNPKFSILNRKTHTLDSELQSLLPSRRKWKKLDKISRIKKGYNINSIEKNKLILDQTIEFYKAHYPSEPFLKNLNNFVSEVQKACLDVTFKFSTPEIYPQRKDKKNPKDLTCRPIANYPLKDSIIIALTNRYFSELFDGYFSECSYAFRAASHKNSGKNSAVTHHDAFNSIIEYKKRFKDKDLYVAECDMQKFYDSVNHTVIKKSFRKLIKRVKRDFPNFYSSDAERLFYKYLDSYKFNKNVLKYNDSSKSDYFKNKNIIGGVFGWVEQELLGHGFYKNFRNAKIGIPQGGALSGLIANIVLDYVDKKVLLKADDDLLFIRFCDDMIVMHPKKDVCAEIFKIYQDPLKELKLVPHMPEGNISPLAEFWKSKSKEPYLWGEKKSGAVSWVGFVGYEIHYNGFIRIRKKTLNKELEKQQDVVYRVSNAIRDGHNKKSWKAIEESVTSSLIGMSVGRVKLWNYKHAPRDLCWAKGFKLLNKNRYSSKQLKRLDQSRNYLLREFKKKIRNIPSVTRTLKNKSSNRQMVYYGKPFSYYYNLLEKK